MAPAASKESPVADIWFLDVGQGDCTVVIDHSTQQAILIDCPSRRVDDLYAEMMARSLVVHSAIVTHWDLDHYGGIARISKAAQPGHVYYNHDTLFTNPQQGKFIRGTLQNFLDLAQVGTELHGFRYMDELQIGSVKIRFLAPTQEEVTRAYLAGKRNVASAVVAVEVGSARVLIGGDAVASTWQRLLSCGEDMSADILRWPHHGAQLHGDSSRELAEEVFFAVRPKRIVITAGFGNRYQHPSKEVIVSATSRGIKVACTQVTAQCFGFHTREEQSETTAKAVLGTVTDPECAGSIYVSVTPSQIIVEPSDQTHLVNIARWPKPLCIAHMDGEPV